MTPPVRAGELPADKQTYTAEDISELAEGFDLEAHGLPGESSILCPVGDEDGLAIHRVGQMSFAVMIACCG